MSQFIFPPVSSSLAAGAATEAEQQLQTAELQAINANTADVATESTLSSLDAKVIAVDTGDVTISSSALPTGAATAANQTTANASLSSIDGKIVAVNTGAVVVSSSALPTGAATSANQSTQITHLATLAGTVSGTEIQVDVVTMPSVTVTATDLDIRNLDSASDSVTVVATNLDIRDLSSSSDSIAAVQSGTWNINNISGTVSLPTGAATAANQTTANASLSSIDGKIVAVNTGAVVVSSSALPTGAATSANQTTANSSLSSIDTKIPANLTVNSTRLLVDGSGVTQPISASSLPLPTGAATAANQTTANASLSSIDGKIVAVNTGAVVVSSSALPTGAATESTLSSLNGKVTAVNTGAVTISTALPAGNNNIGDVDVVSLPNVTVNTLTPVDFLDAGVLDTSSTNIPAGGVTVVTSLAANVKEIEIIDDIGDYMTLTNASNVILAYLPLGGGRVKVSIASGTGLKLASVSGSTLTSGKIAMNFLG